VKCHASEVSRQWIEHDRPRQHNERQITSSAL
jgi:hypothetical protein